MSIYNRSGKGVSTLDTLAGDIKLVGYDIAIEDDPDTGTIGLRNVAAAPTLDIVLKQGNQTVESVQFKNQLTDEFPSLEISQTGVTIGPGTSQPMSLISRNANGTGNITTSTLAATSGNIGTITTNTETVTTSLSTPVLNGNPVLTIASDTVTIAPKTLGAVQQTSTSGNFSANNATIASTLSSHITQTDQIVARENIMGLTVLGNEKVDVITNTINLLSSSDINAYSFNLNGAMGRTDPTTINASAGSTLVIDNVNSSGGTQPVNFNVGINTTDLVCSGDITGDNLTINNFAAQTMTANTLNVGQILPTGSLVSVPAWLATNMITATRGDINDLRTGDVTPTNGPTVGFHGGVGTPNIVAYDAFNITVSDDIAVAAGKTLTAPTIKSTTIGTTTGDLTISPTGTNVVIDPLKNLVVKSMSSSGTNDITATVGGNYFNIPSKTLVVPLISTGTIGTASGELTFAPAGNVTIAGGKALNVAAIGTTSGDLRLNPTNNVTITSPKALNVSTIGTASGDLTLNPASNVTIDGSKSLNVSTISTTSGDLTLNPAGNVVAIPNPKALSVSTIGTAGSDLTLTAGGINVTVDSTKKLSVKTITSSEGDITISPSGSNVVIGEGTNKKLLSYSLTSPGDTLTLGAKAVSPAVGIIDCGNNQLTTSQVNTNKIASTAGIGLYPTNNVVVTPGKFFNVDFIGTSSNVDLALNPYGSVNINSGHSLNVETIGTKSGDLTLSPAGTNVVVDPLKNLVVKSISSSGTNDLTVTPGGTKFIIDATKNLSAKTIVTEGTNDITISPGGNYINMPAKTLVVPTISTSAIGTASGDLTLAPNSNVTILTGKALNVNAIGTATSTDLVLNPFGNVTIGVGTNKSLKVVQLTTGGTSDLRLTPAGTNVVVDTGKKLSTTDIISSGTNDLTITPGGSNVVVATGKTLKADTLSTPSITTDSGDITLTPQGSNVVIGTGKVLKTDTLATSTINTTSGDLTLNPTGTNVVVPKTLKCDKLTPITDDTITLNTNIVKFEPTTSQIIPYIASDTGFRIQSQGNDSSSIGLRATGANPSVYSNIVLSGQLGFIDLQTTGGVQIRGGSIVNGGLNIADTGLDFTNAKYGQTKMTCHVSQNVTTLLGSYCRGRVGSLCYISCNDLQVFNDPKPVSTYTFSSTVYDTATAPTKVGVSFLMFTYESGTTQNTTSQMVYPTLTNSTLSFDINSPGNTLISFSFAPIIWAAIDSP